MLADMPGHTSTRGRNAPEAPAGRSNGKLRLWEPVLRAVKASNQQPRHKTPELTYGPGWAQRASRWACHHRAALLP